RVGENLVLGEKKLFGIHRTLQLTCAPLQLYRPTETARDLREEFVYRFSKRHHLLSHLVERRPSPRDELLAVLQANVALLAGEFQQKPLVDLAAPGLLASRVGRQFLSEPACHLGHLAEAGS